jgi:hypothetical protein
MSDEAVDPITKLRAEEEARKQLELLGELVIGRDSKDPEEIAASLHEPLW